DVLIQFAFWVAIPALLFHIIAEESIDRLLDVAFYMSFGVALVVIFLAVFVVSRNFAKKPTGEATMLAFLAVGSNTAFVALPVLHSVYGERAVLPAAIATVVLVVLILVTTILLERARDGVAEGSSSVVAATGHALLNPLVLSTVLGVAYAVTGWPLPATAKHYLSMLGAAVTPCALFAIGMSIKLEDMRAGAGAILGVSVIKLVVFPAGVLLTALLLDL
ncbi:MAG: AEC family transporter, partial [Pseudomonadota bacterium]